MSETRTRVLITGATGFIGRALVPALLRENHSIVVWTRSEARARALLGADVETIAAGASDAELEACLEGCDAVVNLAGAPLVGRRWTAARRRQLRDSRIGVTERLVRTMAASTRRPGVFVSGSAVGFYGDRDGELLTECASPGTGFLAELCQEWETAAARAEDLGIRVVRLRTGIVLGRDGGMLTRVLPLFRIGLGATLGSGRQYMPWIHLHDLVGVIVRGLADGRVSGPVNAVAPCLSTGREFADALGRAVRRQANFSVPDAVLRLALGEAAAVVRDSQAVDAAALRRLGFVFRFPTLAAALKDLADSQAVAVGPLTSPVDARGDAAGRGYLERRPPRYELRTTTTMEAPLAQAFDFFSRAENLGLLTPASMRFSIFGQPHAIGAGTTIDYRLRVGPVPIAWRSRIVAWMPGCRFVDVQEKGPYTSWWHEHSFRDAGSSTVMEDRVCYAPPLGVLGRIVNRLFIVPALRRIFQYRADVIRLRFGGIQNG